MRIADINSKKERTAEKQRHWDKLLKDINSSLLSEDWVKLADLCKDALNIQENAEVRSKLNKAEEKISEIQRNEKFNKAMSDINELAVRKEFDEANSKLNSLERTLRKEGVLDSAKENIIRDTRRRLFDFGQSNSDVSSPNNHVSSTERTGITGLSNRTHKKTDKSAVKRTTDSDFDWDFGNHSQTKKSQQHQQPSKPQKMSDDSFFDSTEAKQFQSKESRTRTIGKITNDDFNF